MRLRGWLPLDFPQYWRALSVAYLFSAAGTLLKMLSTRFPTDLCTRRRTAIRIGNASVKAEPLKHRSIEQKEPGQCLQERGRIAHRLRLQFSSPHDWKVHLKDCLLSQTAPCVAQFCNPKCRHNCHQNLAFLLPFLRLCTSLLSPAALDACVAITFRRSSLPRTFAV